MIWHKNQIAATAEELRHLALIHEQPCCVCPPGWQPSPTEAHHMTLNGKRMGHLFTLPLCGYHHRGVLLTTLEVPEDFNYVCIADGKRDFELEFGSQRQLWEALLGRLGLPVDIWPTSKIVPRRAV